MSLRVWMPLTKDLRQQGLDSTTVTQNSGTTISGGGKLGSCLIATSNATVVVDLPSLATMLANGSSYSLACWVKITGNVTTNSWIIKLGTNDCGLWWAASEARWVWNENDGGKRCANPTISADTTNWHHLVTTVTKSSNGSTTTARHYVDGMPATSYKIQTWDNSGKAQPTGTTITISPYAASLNDIRLYDHCLSEGEVKKLAQGLIVHYPLNRHGLGQENLITGTNPNDWHSLALTDGTNQCINVFGDATRGFLQATTAGLKVGDIVHVSFDIKFSSNITATSTGTNAITVQGSANNGATWGGLSYSATGCGGIQRTEINNIINSSSKQGRIHTWFIVTSAMLDGTYTGKLHTNVRFDYYTGTVYVKATKVEKGPHATPWCPNSSDNLADKMGLNNKIEYDISGYQYNATNFTASEWSSDTPKYSVSTIFDETVSADVPNIYDSTSRHKQLTFAAWIKRTSDDANYHYYWNNGGVRLGIRAYNNVSNYYWISWTHATDSAYEGHGWVSTVMPKDVWVHVAWVFDSGIWKQYVNGVLNGTRNDSGHGTYIYGDVGSILGNSWIGNLSDIRIYATALSADDVRSLYQNCATIGSDGTIYGQIRS